MSKHKLAYGRGRSFAPLSSPNPTVLRRDHLLAEAATKLSPRLPYAEQLSAVANLAAPEIGDWCVLDVVEQDDDGAAECRIQRVTSTPSDPRLESPLWELEALTPSWTTRDPVIDVLRGGGPLFVPAVTEEWLAARYGDDTMRAGLARLVPQSLLIVPLLVDSRAIGALSIGTCAGRSATEDDLGLAQLLADRGAAGIEAARLYRQAQRSTAARDAVLGVVSHDLIGTLSAVTMNARRLLEISGEEATAQRRLSENILAGADMMHRLMLDLVDFSAIERRRLSVGPVAQSLAPILESARTLFEPRAEALGVRLELADVAALPDALIDSARILQVLSNLIDNALKFTPAGGSVAVSASADQTELLVRVRDTGAGVSVDELPFVFEEFWRSPGSRRTRGLGLGLAIVRGVIAAHGGRVWMNSTVGSGSIVSFTLPLAARSPA